MYACERPLCVTLSTVNHACGDRIFNGERNVWTEALLVFREHSVKVVALAMPEPTLARLVAEHFVFVDGESQYLGRVHGAPSHAS